jgi:hypothetical protein
MAQSFTIQYDALGRPYFDMPGMKAPSYVSPVAMGKTAPADTTGVFRKGPQWNQKKGVWETPIDWSNVLNVGAATALTLGAADAGIFGQGAATLLHGGSASGAKEAVAGVANSISGGAGGGAGMALTPLKDLLVKYGFELGGQLGGAAINSKAALDAAKIQEEYNNKALAAALEEQAYERKRAEEQTAYDRLHGEENTAYTRQRAAELLGYNKDQFGNYLQNLSPYRQAGTSALSRLQDALAGSPWQPNNGVMRSFG